MTNFKFQEEQDPLAEIFSADQTAINISNVWHEMGHVIGNLICKRIGFSEDFGNVKEIHLMGIDNSKVVYEKLFLHIENAKIYYDKSIVDFYGYSNGIYVESANEILLKNIVNDDTTRFFQYLVQLFSGGLFNIFNLNTNPDFDYFEKCFREYDYTSLDKIDGRAGNDWTKCRKYSGYLKADLGEIICFRNELFEFFKEHKLFDFFQELIKNVAKEFNNQIIKDQDLRDILVRIEEILNKIDERIFNELSVKINDCLKKVL